MAESESLQLSVPSKVNTLIDHFSGDESNIDMFAWQSINYINIIV